MSDSNDKVYSFKNRLKSNAPAFAIGVTLGIIVAMKLHPNVKFTGDVWLSERMIKQIREVGSGMVQYGNSHEFIDLIDWAHPGNAKIAA